MTQPNSKSFVDPVCSMQVDDKITLVHKEKTYAFCSDHCKEQFIKNPEQYSK